MSIFSQKRGGKLTGWFIVEVTRNGKRYHHETTDYHEARQKELEFAHGIDEPTSVYTLEDLSRDASAECWLGRKDSDQSIRLLKACVSMLGPDTPLAEVDYERLEEIVRTMKRTKTRSGRPYDNKTVNRYLASMSKALQWAVKHPRVTGLRAMPVVPRQPESEGKIYHLREQEIPTFVQWIREHEKPKVALSVELYAVTGMRLSELLKLKPTQVEKDDSGNYHIMLKSEDTKTNAGRPIPIPARLGEPLIVMLKSGVPKEDAIRDACVRASQALKTQDRITPHGLRHTTATTLVRKGVPLPVVAKQLGHRNIATTMRYIHMNTEEVRGSTNVMDSLVSSTIAASKQPNKQ